MGMAMADERFSDPKAIAKSGEEIYQERYKREFEEKHTGEFVAINVRTGEAHLGSSPEEALEKAKEADNDGIFHLIRVGFRSAFQMSHARHGSDWIFR